MNATPAARQRLNEIRDLLPPRDFGRFGALAADYARHRRRRSITLADISSAAIEYYFAVNPHLDPCRPQEAAQ